MSSVYPELTISYELQTVIMRALEKNPDARYQSMNEFSQALLTTPEGSGAGRPSLISAPIDVGGYAPVAVGSPTAAQFQKPQTLGPAVQAATAGQQSGSRSGETAAATVTTVPPTRSGVGLVLALGGLFPCWAAERRPSF